MQMTFAEARAKRTHPSAASAEVRDLVAEAVRLLLLEGLVVFGGWRRTKAPPMTPEEYEWVSSKLPAEDQAAEIRRAWDAPESRSPHGNLELGAVGWIRITPLGRARAAELGLWPSSTS